MVQLWPGYWVKQMEKMNEAVGDKNRLDKSVGKKQLVHPFRRKELWKCIGCIILTFTYGNKGQNMWRETPIYFGKKAQTKLHRDFFRNTYLHQVCCDIYHPHYYYDFH